MLPADGSKSTRVDGLGDKAIFCPNETGMAMLHVLKGDILVTIGIHGLPANAVLDSEKSMATKNSCEPVVRLAPPAEQSLQIS